MKTLKLVGLQGYISAHTNGVKIEKEQVIEVSDAIADYLLTGNELRYSEAVPHWEVVTGVPCNYKFTTLTEAAPAAHAHAAVTHVAAEPAVHAAKPSQRARSPAPAAAATE